MIKLPFQRKQLPELVFWCVFFLLLVIHCVENTTLTFAKPSWLKGMYLIRNLLYLVLLAKICFLSRYTASTLWAMLGIFLCAGISFLLTDDFTLLEFALIVFAAGDIPSRKLIWMLVLVKGTSIVLTLLCSDLRLLPKLYYIHHDTPLDTLGFCHRNVLGSNMALLCLCWLYLRYRRLNWLDILGCFTLAIVTYFLAISRSSLIIMLLSILVFFLCQCLHLPIRNSSHSGKIIHGFFGAMILFSVLGTILFSDDFALWRLLDKLLTNRLSFAHHCFDQHGFTLFGQQMPFSGTMDAVLNQQSRLILDNAYMRALIFHGLIPGGLFLTLYWVCLHRSWSRRNLPMTACLLIMAFYGLSERFMLDVFYSFPMAMVCIEWLRTPTDRETYTPMDYTVHTLRPLFSRVQGLAGGKQ